MRVLLFLVLCVLTFGFVFDNGGAVLAIWHCKNKPSSSSVHTTVENNENDEDGKDMPCEGSDVDVNKSRLEVNRESWPSEGYYCDPKNRKMTVLGIFINRANDTVDRQLSPSNYGVQVLKEHQVNYEKLNQSLPWQGDKMVVPGSWAIWVFEPIVMKSEARNISTSRKSLNIVYQLSSICGYVNSNTGQMEDRVVKVYSEPATEDQTYWHFGPDCESEYNTRIYIEYDKTQYRLDQTVPNHGSKSRSVCFRFWEGIESIWAPQADSVDLYAYEGRGDDTAELMAALQFNLSGLASPSPVTGLGWPTTPFKLKEYGRRWQNVTFVVPPGKKMKVYQASAMCGYIKVFGPLFPVFIPFAANDYDYKGPCESPFIPLCTTSEGKIGTQDMSLVLNEDTKCRDDFKRLDIIKNASGMPHVEPELGAKGPYLNEVGDELRAKLLHKVNKGVSNIYGARVFDWTKFNVSDWHNYENTKRVIPVPMPKNVSSTAHGRVLPLQLFARCGPYTLYTHHIAFAIVDGINPMGCSHVLGMDISCDGIWDQLL